MYLLQIEHSVPDFDAWKAVFDSDPIDRKGSGMRGYRIHRPAGDPNYVFVDAEFDSAQEAEAVRDTLRGLWKDRMEDGVIASHRARIVETVEARQI